MMKFLPLLGLLFLQQWTFPLHRTAQASGSPCSALPFSDGFTASPGPLSSPWATSPGNSINIQNGTPPQGPAHSVGSGGGFTGGPQNAWPSGCPGWTTSHYAQATITVTESVSHVGLMVQTQDYQNNYYIDCTTGGGCNLEALVGGGTPTYKGTFSGGFANGYVMCLELDSGTSAKLKVNGTYSSAISISGLSGTGGGGLWWGNQGSDGAYWSSFSTGNGVCP